MALIEGQGAVVSKEALMNRVWPHRIVEESSLHLRSYILGSVHQTVWLAADRVGNPTGQLGC
jgi:hypothetical protein